MQQLFISSVQKRIAVGVMAVALLFGTLAGGQSAHAQSTEQTIASLRAQVQELMKILDSLRNNSQNTIAEGGFTNQTFKTGDKVRTVANLNIRSLPGTNGTLLRVLPAGAVGEVVTRQGENYQNPTTVDGYTWYRVQYDALGVTGWSAASWLQVIESTPIEQPADDQPDQAEVEQMIRDLISQIKVSPHATNPTPEELADQAKKLLLKIEDDLLQKQLRAQLLITVANLKYEREADATPNAFVNSISDDVNPTLVGSAVNMNTVSLIISNGDNDLYGSGPLVVRNGQWSHTITRDMKPGRYMVKVYTDNELLEVESFVVSGETDQLTPDNETTKTGLYKGYFKGGHNFITTSGISKANALKNCELNAKNNPTKEVYCTWEGTTIFDNRGQSNNTSTNTNDDSNDTTNINLATEDLLSTHVLEMAIGLKQENLKYDVDQDGKVTPDDSLNIKRVEDGLSPEAPATTKHINALLSDWLEQF